MGNEKKEWFIYINNTPYGPLTGNDIWNKLNSKVIDYGTYIWKKGFNDWKRLEEEPAFDQQPPDADPVLLPKTEETPPAINISSGTGAGPLVWHLNDNKVRSGPFKQSEVIEKIRKGLVSPGAFVWKKGTKEWEPACDSLEFKEYFKNAPSEQAPVEGPHSNKTTKDTRKHKRASLFARVIVHDNQDIAYMPCGNISEGGILLYTDKLLWEKGSQVKLNIKSDDLPEAFDVEGEVMGFTDDTPNGYHIKFSNLSAENRRLLKSYAENKA